MLARPRCNVAPPSLRIAIPHGAEPLCRNFRSVHARGRDLLHPRDSVPRHGLARHESEVAYWVFLATNGCALSSPLRCILKSILSVVTLPVYFKSIPPPNSK